jgi:branched-chain amino acid transport system permease protein
MIYRLGLVIVLATVLTAYLVQHSRLGWGLFSIRDDEDVAEGLGVPTFRYKMTALGISCFFAGLSGGLHALQITFVTVEDVFNIRVPLFVILMSVLGGTRHWMGPVVGATVIFTMTDRLIGARFEQLNQLIIGALLILMVVAVKEGIYSRLRARRWEALALFIVAMLVASTTIGGALLARVSWAMLAVLVLLMIPPGWYSFGRKRTVNGEAEPAPIDSDLEATLPGGER